MRCSNRLFEARKKQEKRKLYKYIIRSSWDKKPFGVSPHSTHIDWYRFSFKKISRPLFRNNESAWIRITSSNSIDYSQKKNLRIVERMRAHAHSPIHISKVDSSFLFFFSFFFPPPLFLSASFISFNKFIDRELAAQNEIYEIMLCECVTALPVLTN